MFEPGTLFQRSDTGRAEIHKKSHGLTQSERLVLIMVDGVASYLELREKMAGLTEERIDRAMRTLLEKELIFEVLLPIPGQIPEQIDDQAVARYLHQDPCDPVTIISFDPEEEFGAVPIAFNDPQPHRSPPSSRSAVGATQAGMSGSAQRRVTPEPTVINVPTLPEPHTIAPAVGPVTGEPAHVAWGVPESLADFGEAWPPPRRSLMQYLGRQHWGYWAIVAGSMLLVISLLHSLMR